MLKNILVAAATACVVSVVTVSCGGPRNLCTDRNIRCDSPTTCDPVDGICKCGGRGGVVCGDGFVCDAVANTCLSTRCSKVDCSDKPGTSCDVVTGECKCGGTGGELCADSATCNPSAKACVPRVNCNQTACPRNQVCDEATGHCKCGATECAAGEACSQTGADGAKVCAGQLCQGVCTGSNTCDPADGYCKCNGVVCQSGEACACPTGSDGGCQATERSCRAGSACVGVTCPEQTHTTCDPVDGVCKCGGPGGPACGVGQICFLGTTVQCQGGAQCTLPDGGVKSCPGGTSCDPEDGQCKCGGRGGLLCAPATDPDGGISAAAEVCVENPTQKTCRKPCDVRNPECPTGQYCYFDSSATTPTAYCSVATDTKTEEAACTTPTACFTTNPVSRSLHCNGLVQGQTGICRAYCDVASGTAGCIQVPRPQVCVQINGAPKDFGYCQPR